MSKHYEQRKEANKKYLASLDEVRIRMPKGKKDELKAFVEECGYSSMNQFVVDAIGHYRDAVLQKMNKGIESVIEDMVKEYENKKTYTDCDEYRKEGAIAALENLLERSNR